MSGGHFEYAYHRVEDFAEQLKRDIAKNKIKDEFGYVRNYSDETIKNLKAVEKLARLTGQLMYNAEWLLSGDDGEEEFNKGFNKHFKKLERIK